MMPRCGMPSTYTPHPGEAERACGGKAGPGLSSVGGSPKWTCQAHLSDLRRVRLSLLGSNMHSGLPFHSHSVQDGVITNVGEWLGKGPA